MPITKSAIKKQRVDKRRTLINRPIKSRMKTAIKTARANPNNETLTELYSVLDIAVKKHLTKKNTAARLKSKIVKMAKEQKIDNPFASSKTKIEKAPAKTASDKKTTKK